MDAAKNAVKGFMSKNGKHDTTVHEEMAPAVTNETVKEHHHENVTTAVDREVHQDHHHTTVQPIHDREVLGERHHHNMAPVEHKHFEHGNDREVQERLQAERAKFKDTTTQGETVSTSSAKPHIHGEHVHHHVHENIQPVIHKETIQPHVTHTTVPIHEVHHGAAQHHSSTALPAISMADFKKQGGALGGREQRSDFFEGEPRNMTGHAANSENPSSEFRETGHVHTHEHGHGHHHGHQQTGTGTGGGLGTTTGTGAGAGLGTNTTTGSSGLTGHNTTGTSGLTGHNTTGTSGLGEDTTTTGTTHTHGDATTTKKPSLLDRMNPMKDTDGDGKKGIMD